MSEDYDAVVVGSGLCGSWAAVLLARAGIRPLVLEAGPRVSPTDLHRRTHRERGYGEELDRSRYPMQSRHPRFHTDNASYFVNDIEHPVVATRNHDFTWIRSRQLGGRSLVWGRVTARVTDAELHAARNDGLSPDWPLSVAELAPWYREAEVALRVEKGVLTPGEEHLRRVISSAVPGAKIGPCQGIPLRDDHGAWPSYTGPGLGLALAESRGQVEVRTNAVVRTIVAEPSKGARAVVYRDRTSNNEREVSTRLVVLAGSTLETTRLLLMSRSVAYPGGLGGSSGCLGRYLMDHLCVVVAGKAHGAASSEYQPTAGGPNGIYVSTMPASAKSNRPGRGYSVTGFVSRGPRPSGFSLATCGEVLPRRDNMMSLHPSLRDCDGFPVSEFHASFGPHEERMRDNAVECLTKIAIMAGFAVKHVGVMPFGLFSHELGTARMGKDPKSSVATPFNELWDARNVLIVDGACWPTSTWKNPSLTMLAITGRAISHAVSRLLRD